MCWCNPQESPENPSDFHTFVCINPLLNRVLAAENGNFNLCMKQIRYGLLLIAAFCAATHGVFGQGCNSPYYLCQSDGLTTFSSAPGTETPLPADLCFESTNTVFVSFNTLTETYITQNDINYIGDAQIDISGLDCDTALFGTPTIEVAVVTAFNACIPATYSDPLQCIDQSLATSLSFDLTDLLPDTTYYVIINTESIENGSPFPCDFDIAINGPAVQYNLDAEADPITIISGETSNLLSNAGFENYQWSGPELEQTDQQNTSVTLEEEGLQYTYNLTAEVDGCEATDQVIVQVVPALTIPNTMTPNGDGYNDNWVIGGLERFPDAEVRVYSRWGQLVHRSRGNDPWDGGELPEAVYYYVIDLNPLGFDTRPYTGYLTIIR